VGIGPPGELPRDISAADDDGDDRVTGVTGGAAMFLLEGKECDVIAAGLAANGRARPRPGLGKVL
jgi:hypothetical protein